MFEEILKLVKDHIGSNQQVDSALPAAQKDEVHEEIASHINSGLKTKLRHKEA
ncbi:hypothetical protein [Mucilaginibacter antarcticus]|uniref:hypothetical protein n=1 Tax=Mucilaginibacter antarcticus TaxID=1855725 RepID=UPI0036457465